MTEGQPEKDQASGIATPRIQRQSGPSIIWLIPLITLLIGGWLVFKTTSEKGDVITLAFQTAQGIEPGKTRIKYKNIEIGIIKSLRFSDNFEHVILTAQMNKEADRLLRRGTKFWVVRPRLSLRQISGLGTLIAGSYIELDPGEGARQRHFTGLESPPVLTTEDNGTKIILMAPQLGSIGIGSPIYYQGILAGEVLGYELGIDQSSVLVHAFVNAPYDDILRGNTRFWNVSGMDVKIDADGLKLHTESIEALMYGGIAFETPPSLGNTSDKVKDLLFTLHPSYESIAENAFTQKIQFVLFFEGSVRGLGLDAPVEFKGIKVGSVRDIRLQYNEEDTTFRIPVLIEIEPQRIVKTGSTPSDDDASETLNNLFKKGLRARLQTASLLTGQLFVELVMQPDTELRLVGTDFKIPELPTIPGKLEELTSTANRFLAKLDKVNIDKIGAELEGTLEGANKLMNHKAMAPLIAELSHSLKSLSGILASIDKRSEPMSENLQEALGALVPTLEQTRNTMEQLDTVLKPDSQLHYRIIQMADELTESARAIRAFVNLMEQHPESLIFGKPPGN